MRHTGPSTTRELVSAAIFISGCLGMSAMLLWLGADGFVFGFALYGLGWYVAMRIEWRDLG